MKLKSKKVGGKALAACLAAVQLLTLAVPLSAAGGSEVPSKAVAGKSNVDPGFTYGSKGRDYVTGQDYYYLENQYVKTLIGPTKAANDQQGPMSNGAIMDAVTQEAKRENLDWTQFFLASKMSGSWDMGKGVLDLNELEVKGNTIVGKGVSEATPNIQGEVTYSIVENTPLIQMQVKLTNNGSEDYNGYFEYQIDPDESGEQNTYVPGVGWTMGNIYTVLTNHEWTGNYIFEGSASKYTGNTAHAILWDEADTVPSGLLNDGYIFGIWYDASLKAGESKTLTFYHLPHQPGGVSEPYAEAAFWAKVVSGEIDISNYGTINGSVTDRYGNPVKNVDITCQYAVGEHAGESAGTTVTDVNGNYSLRVEKGPYTLTASIPGYEQSSHSVDLNNQENPRADIILESIKGTRILDTTSMQSFGGIVEGKPGDYTLENEAFTMLVAKITKDGQLKDSSAGRILDIAANGKSDVMDFIFTSWISDVKPHQETQDNVVPGDSWQQLDTRFDNLEVVSQSKSKIVLKATGVYHHDLANAPESKDGEIEQIITLESGKPYAELETTIRNTSGQELQVYVGDIFDVDGNAQKSYAPGVGDVTAPFNSPIDEKPVQPWFAQYATSDQEVYSFLYEDDFDFRVFGSTNWLMGYAPVKLAADETFTYSRQLIVLDTEGYTQQPEAMTAYYNAYKYGMETRMDVYDGKVQKGDVFPVKVTVENSAEKPIRNVTASLKLPYQMYCVGESEITIPEIPAGGTETVEFSVLALEGGRGLLKSEVRTADDVAMTFSEALSISGQGYYAGDNHTHSIYSDGKGTIRENVDSAYEDKLLNWLYSTDHNKISQYNDTVTETNRLTGNFVNITGTEITSSNKGHALAYGVGSFIPEYRIGKEVNGKVWTWQDTIDQVNSNGGVLYVAHPNYPGLEFSDPYGIREYTGIEVWNGFNHAIDPDKNINTFAFDYWDNVNRRGEQKYFGIANSDGHNSTKMGDPYIKTEMDNLSYDNIQDILANGSFYGSNGPELRYDIEGVGMGETLTIKESGNVDFNITAFDQNYDLVNVKLIKNTITGSAEKGEAEVVFNKDLKGQGLSEFKTTLSLPVKAGEFYRVEVTSEQGTTGNGGNGEGQGLGFAFSNPIWISDGEKSNATDIKKITYAGGQVIETVGDNMVITVEDVFSVDKLNVEVSDEAAVRTEVIDAVDDELDTAAAVKITVTAEDGTQDVETVFLTKGKVEETPAEIISFTTAFVKTEEGKQPQMPETVEATYDNGSIKSVAVDWDEVTEDMVAEPGIFKVEGTVTGTTIKAEAFVQVVPGKDVENVRGLLQKTYKFAQNLSSDGVTDSAKVFFEKAKEQAKAALENPSATQEELSSAWDTLLEGIWGLGLYQPDKATLGLLIEKAESMVAQEDKYVKRNWQKLVDSLAQAKTVMDDGDAMEDEVSFATEELLNSIHLQLYKADKAILESLIQKAEGLDLTSYTQESVAVLKSALLKANAVYADVTLSINDQEKVDEAADSLNEAMNGLVKLSDVSGGNNTGNNQDSNTGNNQDSNSGNNQDNNSGNDQGKEDGAGDNQVKPSGDSNVDGKDHNDISNPQTGESRTGMLAALLAGISSLVLLLGSRVWKRKTK